MSDSRRRRKSQQSGGSDDLSESYDELNATKETQSSEHTEDQHDSEYDTAGSDSDTESQDKNQRESGDGQEEEKTPKKLECDEDRRNPQYIPKRGTFYEHDVRTADEVNDEITETQPEREVKDKKVWKDKEDRWDHDRYNDEEQAPKSHAELIAVYGYDIRNEEGPPRARRRRRYGRGPNKYTRNWEDEDAYGKVAGSVPMHKTNIKKSNRTGEDFPLLNSKDNDVSKMTEEEPVITSAWYSNKNKIHLNKIQNFPPLQQTDGQKPKSKQFTNSQVNENKVPNERNNLVWKREVKHTPYIQNTNECNVATGDTEKIVIVKTTPRDNKRSPQVQETVNFTANKSRGRGFKANTNNNIIGSRTIESKPKGRGSGLINTDNRRSNIEHEQIISDMKHMNLSTEGPSYHHATRQNKHFYTQPSSQQHSTLVPPRIQPSHPQQQPPPSQQQAPQQTSQQDISTNRPKRYSSLRQRPPIAEGPTNSGQPNYQSAPQHTYYPTPQAGSSRAVLESPGYPPGPYEQTAPVSAAGTAMTGQSVIPIPPGAQPTNYAPHAPHAPHAPPPFLVPPPQFIPSQTAPPSIINYVTGPNGPIFQPNYQGYNPAAVQPGPPPPQEVGLYQPQGCTYYSPAQQQQQQQQQPVPLRRPKAAIPILPPPDNLQNQNNRGRNRNTQQQLQPQVQEQLQQQQQQEQAIQQQLQQHQQHLIEQQQEEEHQQLIVQQQHEHQQLIEQQQQEHQQLIEQQLQNQHQQLIEQQQQDQHQQLIKQQHGHQQLIEQQLQDQHQQLIKQQQQDQHQQLIEQQQQKQQQFIEQQLKDQHQQLIEQQQQDEHQQLIEQQQQKQPPLIEQQLQDQPQQHENQQLIEQQQQKHQQFIEEHLQNQHDPLIKQQQQDEHQQLIQQYQQDQQNLIEQQQEHEQVLAQQEEQQQLDDGNSSSKIVNQLNEEITSQVVGKLDRLYHENFNISTNITTILSLEETTVADKERSVVSSEEKLLEVVLIDTEAGQSKMLAKVEVVPDIVPDVKEKAVVTTIATISEATITVTTASAEVTADTPVTCIVESTATIASKDVKELSTKSVQLLSGKNETDCSIKESSVIEEAAA